MRLARLFEHEQVVESRVVELAESIRENGVLQPILVDATTKVILDGHHRFNAAKRLGMQDIPALLVDYEDEVEVFARRPDVPVSKQLVVETALRGELFPPKTTRHALKQGVVS